jgi:DNA-binding MarR family transcriptional regulator
MEADDPTLTLARLARLLENHGTTELTLPQYRVLGLLAGGDERASQLAARLAVAKPTLTSLVDSLVERGFAARETLDGDRRVVRVSITQAGRVALRQAAAELRQVFATVLDRCADPEAVLAALVELRQALDSLWAERAAEQFAGARREVGR